METPADLSWEEVIGPDTFEQHGYPHEAWARLRELAPVAWFDLPEKPGFWAVTRRADVIWLSKQPTRFHNGPRLAVFPEGPIPEEAGPMVRHLLNMDPPDHARFRNVASGWFTPRAIGRRRGEVERITTGLIDGLRERGGQADFVADFTAPLTLSVLADMLGVPREDWELMFRWTNVIAGSDDPEFQGEGDAIGRARDALFKYFAELALERRERPRDDMVSVLARAEIQGGPIPPLELLSYFLLLVVAGNETTRNAASGGLLALIERPDEWRKLRADASLVEPAVEEIVRFTSPVIQFCRTATQDFEMHGQTIGAGEALCLLYPSANRDEETFEDPNEFHVDRRPNPHLGFGIGEHFCLGANLARLELRVMFDALARRMDEVELAGPIARMRSSFLGGVKRMPIRYAIGN